VDPGRARAKAERLLDRLDRLTRANLRDFEASPALLAQFWRDFDGGGFEYQIDRWACPELECWDTYRELLERVRTRPRPWDCKKASAALGAALLRDGAPIVIGLRPGENVSHAVLGVLPPSSAIGSRGPQPVGTAGTSGPDPRVRVLDPSVWTGMSPLKPHEYAETHWRRITT
jgi:hypothetical protein